MRLLGLDWGTTSLRAYLVDAKGEIIEQASSPDGLTRAREEGFEAVFERNCAKLVLQCDLVVMSGMVGAREGWVEAQYRPCPVDCKGLAGAMVPLGGLARPAWIAPGLCTDDGARPDVMRGEETQVLGCLEAGLGDGVYVLPGTHTKWVMVDGGKIVDFATFMTGDVYRALGRHSVLKLMVEDDAPLAEDAFARGVEAGKKSASDGMLLAELFGARTLGLFDRLPPTSMASYLSGLLLGNELSCGWNLYPFDRAILVGDQELVKRYALACDLLRLASTPAPEDVVVKGQLALARNLA